jgi:hypothetical protein
MIAIMSSRKRSPLLESEDAVKRRKLSSTLLENEIQSLRAELEHERALRELDQRRAAQAKARFERQVQFASEEAEEAKILLEEVRRTSEEHARTLREGRQEALAELRDCQARLNEFVLEQQGRSGYEDKAAKKKWFVWKLGWRRTRRKLNR